MSRKKKPKFISICRTELRLLNPTKDEVSDGIIPMETHTMFESDMCEVYSRIDPAKWEALVSMYNYMIGEANDMFVDGLLEIGEERLNKGAK